MAAQYMMNNPDQPFYTQRGFSQFTAGLLGVGFKGRTPGDALIDRAYSEMNSLMLQRPNLSPDAYSMGWQKIKEQYPFMETVMLSRKADDVRDESYVWAILNRIPPGSQSNIFNAVNLDPNIMDKFYENKGLKGMAETDKLRMMAAVKDIGLVLAVPDGTTSHEWSEARTRNSLLSRYIVNEFGQATKDNTDQYYQIIATKDYTAADAFLQQHPDVQASLEYRQQVVLTDPLLAKFYGGIDYLENYYRSRFYKEVGKQLGSDIFKVTEGYYLLKDNDGDTAAYVRDHPEMQKYWDLKAQYDDMTAKAIDQSASLFPDKPTPLIRSDADLNSVGAQDILKGINQTTPDQDNAALLAKYAKGKYTTTTGEFSITKQIEGVAEQRWPGILSKEAEFQRLSGTDLKQAQAFYNQNPDLEAFHEFKKSQTASYNAAMKGNFDKANQQMMYAINAQVDDYLRMIVKSGQISAIAQKMLSEIGQPYGMDYQTVIQYIR
jgi:hypothetical protein